MRASEIRLNHLATFECAKPIRHALGAFLRALELESDFCEDVLTATGEAMANALEHAYAGEETVGTVEMYACEENEKRLCVPVRDHGKFIVRDRNPKRGFGLPILQAIAHSVVIETIDGTRIQMFFEFPLGWRSK